MKTPSIWIRFDPQPFIEELSGRDSRLQNALMKCRNISWDSTGTMGYFQKDHPDIASLDGWHWDETLATAVQVGASIFVIDFQIRGNDVRAYRVEQAIQMSLAVDDR